MKKIVPLVLLFYITLASAQDLSVLTYNIKYDNPADSLNNWGHRKEFLIGQLRFYAPDIFGVQEGLLHQLQDMDAGLEQYSYIGVGRDDGGGEGEFSAIFYNTHALQMLREGTFWLSQTPETPSKGWDAAYKRICTYGLFKQKKSGRQFYMFNTHFDHIGDQARIESAKLILAKIKAINTAQLPVVLTGDFNLEPSTEGIHLIKKALADSYEKAGNIAFGPQGTFNGFHFDEPVARKIDYIFISKDFKVEKHAVLSDNWNLHYPSDHLPVYTLLKFN